MPRGNSRALRLPRDLLEAAGAVLLAAPLWLLPERGAILLGRFYGRVLGALWPTARRAGMINLRRAYGPALSYAEARRWTQEVFAGMGQGLAEAVQFLRRCRGGDTAWESRYVPEDAALEARLLAEGRPTVFVLSHLGSWDVAAMMLGRRVGSRGAIVYRRIDNPLLEALVARVRSPHAGALIEKRGAAPEAVRWLRDGGSIALLLDESGGRRGLFLDFFGRSASTLPTAALLALRTGARVVVGAAVRRPGRRFLFRLAEIDVPAAVPARPDGAVAELTGRILRVVEGWIREDPLQWRWVHWRWKHRPDGSEETYGEEELRAAFPEAFASPARRPNASAGEAGRA